MRKTRSNSLRPIEDTDIVPMFYRVLGSTAVDVNGIEVGLDGPVQRRLLTALLAANGAPVPNCRLIEQVWQSLFHGGASTEPPIDRPHLRPS